MRFKSRFRRGEGGRWAVELPGQQLGDQGRQEHHQGGRTVLGRTVAAVGRAGLAELGLDVRRRLSVDAAVGLGVDVLPGARAGNHHAVVNDLLHLLADGTRRALLVERVRAGPGRVAAVHEAPAPLLLRDDVLAERIVAEGRRRRVRRASPASQGTRLLECSGHQEDRHEQQSSELGHSFILNCKLVPANFQKGCFDQFALIFPTAFFFFFVNHTDANGCTLASPVILVTFDRVTTSSSSSES